MPKTRDPNEQKEKFCIEKKNLNIFVFHAMNLFPTFPLFICTIWNSMMMNEKVKDFAIGQNTDLTIVITGWFRRFLIWKAYHEIWQLKIHVFVFFLLFSW